MKKLQSFAFYALVTPVITFGSGALLAQQPAGQDADAKKQSTPYEQDTKRSTLGNEQSDQGIRQNAPAIEQAAANQRNARDQSQLQHRGYIGSAPANGMQANDLIGAKVTTTGGESVGPVDDLIVDSNGQIVAIVVGVGGFLSLGEKSVAIGWDDVTKSGSADKLELQIMATREALSSAPEYKKQK